MVAKRAVAAREERRMAVRGGERVVRAVVVIITVMRTLEALVWYGEEDRRASGR